jgi:hypothetical protein
MPQQSSVNEAAVDFSYFVTDFKKDKQKTFVRHLVQLRSLCRRAGKCVREGLSARFAILL